MTRLLIALALVGCSGNPGPAQGWDRALPFRAILQGYPATSDPLFWDRPFWTARFQGWSREGFTAVVWFGPGEFTNGDQLFLRHLRFPEARELAPEESEKRIAQLQWLFQNAHDAGLQNVLLTQHIFFTEAFGKAHDLLKPMPVSPEVSHRHNGGIPDLWRPGRTLHSCGVRNELTIAYTRALYEEFIATYPTVDGFYGMIGEPLPGRRSSFFREAIAPALGNRIFIACQWQVPLDDFMADIAPADRIWVGIHGYNSEQITDAKPYPGVVEWSEKTGLPTIPEVYPANANWFPWNSPRFAFEISRELKRVPGIAGFIYSERYVSGTLRGPLFRKALARYTAGSEPYSDGPWLDELEKEFGNRAAAAHFLKAYDISCRIIPELCALLYSGGDVIERVRRIPYEFLATNYPWSHLTSPVRGGRLIPIRRYASMVAAAPGRFRDANGSEPDRAPFYQESLWGSEGGSMFEETPPAHMRRIRLMGEAALAAAEEGLKSAPTAAYARDLMKALQLLSNYYEKKVRAGTAALVHAIGHRDVDRQEAEDQGDQAVAAYRDFVRFMDDRVNPECRRLGTPPLDVAGMLQLEEKDREDLPALFRWPRKG